MCNFLPGSIGNQRPSFFKKWSSFCLVTPGCNLTSKSSGWYSKILSSFDKFKQIPPFCADSPPVSKPNRDLFILKSLNSF